MADFATGGFFVAGRGASVTIPGDGVSSQTQTRGGWTAGGGVEATINRNWSIKLEYLYVDLQNQIFVPLVWPCYSADRHVD